MKSTLQKPEIVSLSLTPKEKKLYLNLQSKLIDQLGSGSYTRQASRLMDCCIEINQAIQEG